MTRARRVAFALAAVLAVLAVPAAGGKVVHENVDDVPPGCDGPLGETALTLRAGRRYADAFPGAVWTFDNRSFEIPACTRVTITFVNEDAIRHQFMIHGTWPMGFFQIEVDGPGEESGTFITGSEPRTRLVHCGVPQHQQKGMKGQLLVDGGNGVIPNILGVSGLPPEDRPGAGAAASADAPVRSTPLGAAEVATAVLVAGALAGRRFTRGGRGA